jgi:hypothetical protein
MVFTIKRSSGDLPLQPVPESVLRPVPFNLNVNGRGVYQWAYFKTVEEARKRCQEGFFLEKRVNSIYLSDNGLVVIEAIKCLPTISFESLDDLLKFVDREKDIIIMPYGPECLDQNIRYGLEIYDSYRE